MSVPQTRSRATRPQPSKGTKLMSYQSAEAAWRVSIDYSDTEVTMAEWLCSCHQSDAAGPVIRREVWLHGATDPAMEHYRLDPDGDNHTVPDWVPRPPEGWDQFPISQAESDQ